MLFAKLKDVLLYGTSFKLRSYERATLDAWRGRLSADGRTLLDAQLKHLVSYQRQAGAKELVFFTLDKRPYPGVPQEFLFPCRLGSCSVARVHLAGVDGSGMRHRLKADVDLHKGRLISIGFNQPPAKKLRHDVEVTKVEILRDPMIPAFDETTSDAQRRKDTLAIIQSKLPDEYLKLVSDGRGVSVNDWAICAVQDIRKIPQRDGNYYLLADKEGMGAIGVREDEFSGQLYYLDYGADLGERITVSLRKFIEEKSNGVKP